MQIERIEISKLVSDPANVRKHGSRNLDSIVASLHRFGQQKPIVIDKANIVRAGNGTLEAARSMGWTHLDCVRTDLQSSDAIAYAIADNRTAELAEWDDDMLAAQLNGLLADDEKLLEAAGYTAEELDALLDNGEGEEGGEEGGELKQSLQLVPDREYCLIVCRSPDEWELLRTVLKLGLVRRGGYKEGSAFDSVGIERVVDFERFIKAVQDVDSDTIEGQSGQRQVAEVSTDS